MNRGQTRAHRLDRREFLRRSGAVAGSVVLLQIAIPLGACASASSSSDAPPATVASNAFLRLHADNSISFLSPAAEIGQGTSSTLAMIACDELGADWSKTRSEEHTSELQSLMRISYAVFCLKKKIHTQKKHPQHKNKAS